GRGSRAGGGLPKQWRSLAGRPVILHTLAAFHGWPVVVTIHPEDRDLAARLLPGIPLIEGGETRAASVRAALEAMAGKGFERVMIHDAARPLLPAGILDRLSQALDHAPAAAPA